MKYFLYTLIYQIIYCGFAIGQTCGPAGWSRVLRKAVDINDFDPFSLRKDESSKDIFEYTCNEADPAKDYWTDEFKDKSLIPDIVSEVFIKPEVASSEIIEILTEDDYVNFVSGQFKFTGMDSGLPRGSLMLGEMYKNIREAQINKTNFKVSFSGMKRMYRVVLDKPPAVTERVKNWLNKLPKKFNKNKLDRFDSIIKNIGGTHYFSEIIFGSVYLDINHDQFEFSYDHDTSPRHNTDKTGLPGTNKYNRKTLFGRKLSRKRYAGEEKTPLEFYPIGGKLESIASLVYDGDQRNALNQYLKARLDLAIMNNLKASVKYMIVLLGDRWTEASNSREYGDIQVMWLWLREIKIPDHDSVLLLEKKIKDFIELYTPDETTITVEGQLNYIIVRLP